MPDRFLPGTTSPNHGRKLLATKGAGRLRLLVECETRSLRTVDRPYGGGPGFLRYGPSYVVFPTTLRPRY